jgi:hypothetical protein
MSALAALRQQLAEIIAPPVPGGETIATGIASLDAVLEGGGIPCGRLTDLAGAPGSGATTLTRGIVAGALADKRWVAYVDATRTLAPGDWTALSATGRLWIVRPPEHDQGAWSADVLLRSGAFGLVVLDGTPPLKRSVFVRLNRLARESQAALLVVRHDNDATGLIGSALRLHLQRHSTQQTVCPRRHGDTPSDRERWRSVSTRLAHAAHGPHLAAVPSEPASRAPSSPNRTTFTIACTVRKGGGGGQQTIEVDCAIDVARRLRADTAIPDRRGVAKRNRQGKLVVPSATGAATVVPDGAGGATLPRKRRCAEPDVRHNVFLLDKREHPGPVLPSINYALGTDKRERQIKSAVAESKQRSRRPRAGV